MNFKALAISPAANVYDVLAPLFAVSKILGLGPFRFVRGDRREPLQPHFGVITLLRFLLMAAGMYYVDGLTERVVFTGTIAKLALLSELYLGTFATAVALVMAVANQRALVSAIARINSIDEELKDIKSLNAGQRRLQKCVYAQIAFLTVVFFCNITLQAFSDTDAMLLGYSCFNVVDYITSMMTCQYVNLLLIMRQRFVWLNARVRNLGRYHNKTTKLVAPLGINNCFKATCFYRENEKKRAVEFLGKLYYKLCDISKVVNRIYAVQLLVLIGCSFIMITTQLINAYFILTIPGEGDAISYLLLLIYVSKILLKLFAIVATSESVSAKAHDTGVYLHDLWQLMTECRQEVMIKARIKKSLCLKVSRCDRSKSSGTMLTLNDTTI